MRIKPNFLLAWFFLTLALSLHVLDEALNNFLALYNPLVNSINERMKFSLLPVFSFTNWLTSLIIGITILFGLSFFANQKKKWIIYLGFFYGGLMLLNAFGHLLGSVYYDQLIAGTYTAPLLLIGSVYLLWSSNKTLKSNR